ncbi:MAG: cation diffusion facilitator family transporter, partial [Hyphomicrobiales bacterium]|nr:cation diffusion facilitator family transporter [Hyphomicrobiales bacterium]
KPADDTHHYGHAKVESVAALIETGLLFLTSAWIIYEAGHRLLSGTHEVEATFWAIGVIVVSIVVDFFRARALTRTAEATGSQALAADALHFSSDMLSSGVVLIGLGAVALGYPAADPIAAVGVALFVLLAGYRLGRRTIDTLIDAAPEGAVERIREVVGEIPGVVEIERLRVRPAGHILFVDIEIGVARTRPLDQVSELTAAIRRAIVAEMPEAEPAVIAHPRVLDDETVHDRIMVIAGNRALAVHHVIVQTLEGRLSVSLDLEVDGALPLGEAHAIASGLEDAIVDEIGPEVEVETHIEPFQSRNLAGTDLSPEEIAEMQAEMSDHAHDYGIRDVHDLRVRQTPEGLIVNFHCRFDPSRSVADVHDAVDQLERRARARWPGIHRIVGHAEPVARKP